MRVHLERIRLGVLWSATIATCFAPSSSAAQISEIIDSTGDGQGNTLNRAFGVAASADGDVYVTGAVSGNAFKISATGVITEIIDSQGAGTGSSLATPWGVAIAPTGASYVTGAGSRNVFKISGTGVITEIIDSTGDGAGNGLSTPLQAAVDFSGNLIVSGSGSHNAFRVSPSATITQIIDSTGDNATNPLSGPVGVAVDAFGNVFIAGAKTHNAFKVSALGAITEIIDSEGDGAGNLLSRPKGIATDHSGNVFVAGELSHNVFRISPSGLITQIIDSSGDGQGNQLTSPGLIAVDSQGNVFVPGTNSHNVFKIAASGSITKIIDSTGDGLGNTLNGPLQVAVDAEGNVFVPGSNSSNVFKVEATDAVVTQEAYLKASNTNPSDFFGYSVAASGNTLVVGAYLEDSSATGVDGNQFSNSASNSGAAYIFVRDGSEWSQQAYLKASNTATVDVFGWSVAIDGGTAVVGAWGEDSSATGVNADQANDDRTNSGAAYVFIRSGTIWSQEAYLKASNSNNDDHFGASVAISGDTIVVGAWGEDSALESEGGGQTSNALQESGAVYVFARNGSTWDQQAFLKASNAGAFEHFGSFAKVSSSRLAIGADLENSDAIGIGGDQSNNDSFSAGAAYVFNRVEGTWSQRAYLKASNTDPEDIFGRAAALSGNTLVVGAHFEDSNANGVNSEQANNNSLQSGAAYVFDLASAEPPPLDFCSGDGGDQQGCTDCPCLNSTAPGSIGGCLNSAGLSARLIASGSQSVSLPKNIDSDLRFALSGVPPLSFSILISGDSLAPGNPSSPCFGLNSGGIAPVFDGLRCAIGNTRRHGGRGSDLSGQVGVSNAPWGGEANPVAGIAQTGGSFVSGQLRFFQVIYREDPLAACMRGLNTSQAVRVTFTP